MESYMPPGSLCFKRQWKQNSGYSQEHTEYICKHTVQVHTNTLLVVQWFNAFEWWEL